MLLIFQINIPQHSTRSDTFIMSIRKYVPRADKSENNLITLIAGNFLLLCRTTDLLFYVILFETFRRHNSPSSVMLCQTDNKIQSYNYY